MPRRLTGYIGEKVLGTVSTDGAPRYEIIDLVGTGLIEVRHVDDHYESMTLLATAAPSLGQMLVELGEGQPGPRT